MSNSLDPDKDRRQVTASHERVKFKVWLKAYVIQPICHGLADIFFLTLCMLGNFCMIFLLSADFFQN